MPQMDGIDDTKDVVAAEGGQLQEALTYFPQKMHSMQVQTMSRHRVKVK